MSIDQQQKLSPSSTYNPDALTIDAYRMDKLIVSIASEQKPEVIEFVVRGMMSIQASLYLGKFDDAVSELRQLIARYNMSYPDTPITHDYTNTNQYFIEQPRTPKESFKKLLWGLAVSIKDTQVGIITTHAADVKKMVNGAAGSIVRQVNFRRGKGVKLI